VLTSCVRPASRQPSVYAGPPGCQPTDRLRRREHWAKAKGSVRRVRRCTLVIGHESSHLRVRARR